MILQQHFGIIERVRAICYAYKPEVLLIINPNDNANKKKEYRRVWLARRKCTSRLRSMYNYLVNDDVIFPLHKGIYLLRSVKKLAHILGLQFYFFGHAYGGLLHFYLCKPLNMKMKEWKKRQHTYSLIMLDLLLRIGGALTGEHGIGRSKLPFIPNALHPSHIARLQVIKLSVDPNWILNPNVKIPFPIQSLKKLNKTSKNPYPLFLKEALIEKNKISKQIQQAKQYCLCIASKSITCTPDTITQLQNILYSQKSNL